MLSSLKFVQGAIAKKDFVPALTHFSIKDKRIKGYNGSLALCGPIDLDLEVVPLASSFVKAIKVCKETVSMHVQEKNGKLVIQSGSFKAFVDCLPEGFPEIEPMGEMIATTGNIIKTLKKLEPFIATDASRPWATGILFRGESAYATNNACLVECWLGYKFPIEVCIPKEAVTEILRINQEPTAMQVCDQNITFHFEGGKWLRAQQLALEWPDIQKILNSQSEQKPIPKGLFEAIEDLIPFGDDICRIYFKDGTVSTTDSSEEGASFKLEGLPETGCYSAHFLKLLGKVADTADFEAYPKPCYFFGENLRGVIVGVRA